ncbi:MAG TPA: hypothetical protein VF136_12605 [Methylomirabilota bacterium]
MRAPERQVMAGVVLDLTVEAPAPFPPPDSDPLQVWRDVEGQVCAWATQSAAGYTMAWPGLGVYRFEDHTPVVSATPLPSVAPERMADVFTRGVAPIVLLTRGFEVLHASAVRLGPGVVAFCARSGTGKSTLAHALSARGHEAWADDALPIMVTEDNTMASRLPFVPRVDSGRTPAGAAPRGWPPRRIVIERPARLAGIVMLERGSPEDGAIATVQRTAPAAAFSLLMPHAHDVDLGGFVRRRALVEHLLAIVERVPVYELRFEPDLLRLGDLAAFVEERFS